MEVSKLTISDNLKHQTGNVTKILLWMQSHPKQCKRTNISMMSRACLLDRESNIHGSQDAITQTFQRALRKGLIERRNGKMHANFFINYYHPELPPQVREAKNENEETDGPVLVTLKPISEPEEQTNEPRATVGVDKETQEEIAESDAPDIEEPEPIVSEPISIKAGDGEIKLSITLNINIAR